MSPKSRRLDSTQEHVAAVRQRVDRGTSPLVISDAQPELAGLKTGRQLRQLVRDLRIPHVIWRRRLLVRADRLLAAIDCADEPAPWSEEESIRKAVMGRR